MDKIKVDHIKYIEENFSTITSLVLGLMIVAGIFIYADNFFTKFISGNGCRGFIYILLLFLWGLIWMNIRFKLPRNKKNMIGLILCIKTEDDKQKVRIKNDLVKRLNELIRENNLDEIINVILIKPHQTESFFKKIAAYSKKINSVDLINQKDNAQLKELKKWAKVQKNLRGHFFIWGDVKKREDNESTYFIDIDALVIHKRLPLSTKIKMQEEFNTAWFKKISFKEAVEFKGFNFTADVVFMAAKYLTGIAALISLDPSLALKLHKDLSKDLDRFKPLPPKLAPIKEKLPNLMAEENLLLARIYQLKGDLNKSEKYLADAFSINNNYYEGYILKSVLELQEGRPEQAMNAVNKAAKYAKDGTWLYNKAFLLMDAGNYEEAFKLYKKISNNSFYGEDLILAQVYQFNENLIKEDPTRPEPYFILGFLKYKKSANYPEAVRYLDKFLKLTEGNDNYLKLTEVSKSYNVELERKMDLRK